jgi:hypothetical protein
MYRRRLRRASLAAYLSLVYTPQWVENMSDRARLDRAGAGGVRLLAAACAYWLGAAIFSAQCGSGNLHAQAFGIPGAVAVSVGAAISGDGCWCSFVISKQPAAGDGQHAGGAGPSPSSPTVRRHGHRQQRNYRANQQRTPTMKKLIFSALMTTAAA